MSGPIAVANVVLGLRNLSGQEVCAPLGVWVGALLQALPPIMREDVIQLVEIHLQQAAQHGQPTRIIMP